MYKEINEFESEIKRFTDTRIMSLMEKSSDTFQDFVEVVRSNIYKRTGEITVSIHPQIADELHLIVLKEIARRWAILKDLIE
jgi:hypothetical protein